ncbi:hypothetical protein AB0I28_33875 [Phytomonospora sp. NPDC050363]|uniref:hypothetical protein n=1 Tax=Phytomonospora sp. NPDC050363 TaxID=3155642 RepID=UPI0033C34ED8
MGQHGDQGGYRTRTARFGERGRSYELAASARGRRQRRVGRLCLRIAVPVMLLALVAGLGLLAYATLGGAPASYESPYRWGAGAVFLAGGPIGGGGGNYSECLVRPDVGEVRSVGVTSGGVRLDRWFEGAATILCGRSVSVTSGPQLPLYPFALNRGLLLTLAVAIVVVGWSGYRLTSVAASGSRR